MARNNRKAFTLVEMLVVIVIITMLVALLVPAVIGARARARRVSCMNRMSEAGKAIAQYEAAKGYLPGYVNRIGGGTIGATGIASNNNLSWSVVILEYMGRGDLWRQWRVRPPTGLSPPRENNPDYTVTLEEYICPSDTERRGKAGALSYAVNCGISDERSTSATPSNPVDEYTGIVSDAYNEPALGLFFDHDDTGSAAPYGLPGTKIVKIGLDEIRDGAQQTIMLSENLDASSWSSAWLSSSLSEPVVRQGNVGILWWSNVSSLTWATDVPTKVQVNAETSGLYKARPSSNHPGGVNVVFADGHADFISDRVDYATFRDQMISDQSKATPLAP